MDEKKNKVIYEIHFRGRKIRASRDTIFELRNLFNEILGEPATTIWSDPACPYQSPYRYQWIVPMYGSDGVDNTLLNQPDTVFISFVDQEGA